MNKEEIRFIDKLYKDLYLSEIVERHTNSKDKYKRIKEYITKLEEIHNGMVNHNHIDILKIMYYDKYVIKEENIPDSYYKNQERMYFERGHGHVILNEKDKKELNKIIIEDQKKSLDTWLDYFLSSDSNYIPFWAKYWAFQGMLKLGSFDKNTGKYTKRSKHTVTKFADLNREALALSIDTLLKYLNKKEINDKELEALIKTGSFGSIYTYITNKLISNNNIIKRNKGKWIKYDRGTDHMLLVKSLQGYNTGWCTAGEDTAKLQLQSGDFYVYYTLDQNDEYRVPRIAIRMEGNKIGEIRGVSEQQNLEPEMEEVVAEKIKDFPDKDLYFKKVNDMEKLTVIYKKYKNNEELTKEDLKFLYEIDSKIKGFGYNTDPRIREIIRNRDEKKDISYIFNINKRKIAFRPEEIKKNTKYYYGNLILYPFEYANQNIPKILKGTLMFLSIPPDKTINNLKLPDYINGNLVIECGILKNIDIPENITGDISIKLAHYMENIKFPEKMKGSIYGSYVTQINKVKFPKEILGDMCFDFLENYRNTQLPDSVGGDLYLGTVVANDEFKFPKVGNKLSISSFIAEKEIEISSNIKFLHLINIENCKNIKFPEIFEGTIHIDEKNIEGLVLSKEIKGSLCLSSAETLNNVKLPEKVGGTLHLNKLKSLEGVILPSYVGNDVSLGGLESLKGLKLPNKINGFLNFFSIREVENLILPEEISGSLNLSNLKKAKNLMLPKILNGYLYINNLMEVDNLIFPMKKFSEDISLSNLLSAKKIVFPKIVEGNIIVKKLKYCEELVLPKKCNSLWLIDLDELDYQAIPNPLTYVISLKNEEITPENFKNYINRKRK